MEEEEEEERRRERGRRGGVVGWRRDFCLGSFPHPGLKGTL
jgi:hypothetical protein